MLKSMLTTIDNPYDPFDNFSSWYAWDIQAGYHTCSFLARIVVTSTELSDSDANLANTQAIDEIVRENVLGVYRKVTREIPNTDFVFSETT